MPTGTIGSPSVPLYEQWAEAQKQLKEVIAMVAPGEWSEPATPHGRVLRDHLIRLTQKMGEAIKRSGKAEATGIASGWFLPEVGNTVGVADLLCTFYRMEHLAGRFLHLYESYGLALSPDVYHHWVPIIGLYRHCTAAIREQRRNSALHTHSSEERWRRGGSLKR